MDFFWRSLAHIGLLVGLLGVAPAGLAQPMTDPMPKPISGALWKPLKPHEKKALAPLADQWGELTATQRSKWLAIAQQFDQLSLADQQVMQTRMAQWVALNPVQRNQARLHFHTVQSLPKDEKKSRWDEYQNLSDTEKRKFSVGVLTTSKTAAPSPRPSGAERLVQPTVRTLPASALPARTPIDPKTLLPLPANESPSAAPSRPPTVPLAAPTPSAS